MKPSILALIFVTAARAADLGSLYRPDTPPAPAPKTAEMMVLFQRAAGGSVDDFIEATAVYEIDDFTGSRINTARDKAKAVYAKGLKIFGDDESVYRQINIRVDLIAYDLELNGFVLDCMQPRVAAKLVPADEEVGIGIENTTFADFGHQTDEFGYNYWPAKLTEVEGLVYDVNRKPQHYAPRGSCIIDGWSSLGLLCLPPDDARRLKELTNSVGLGLVGDFDYLRKEEGYPLGFAVKRITLPPIDGPVESERDKEIRRLMSKATLKAYPSQPTETQGTLQGVWSLEAPDERHLFSNWPTGVVFTKTGELGTCIIDFDNNGKCKGVDQCRMTGYWRLIGQRLWTTGVDDRVWRPGMVYFSLKDSNTFQTADTNTYYRVDYTPPVSSVASSNPPAPSGTSTPSVSSITAGNPSASTEPSHNSLAMWEKIVTVAGNTGWQDSGLNIEQGRTYSFTASGTIQAADPLLPFMKTDATPAGWDARFPTTSKHLCPTAPSAALIGRISGSGSPFLVGNGVTITATTSGTLFLSSNCLTFKKNTGSWQVTVQTR